MRYEEIEIGFATTGDDLEDEKMGCLSHAEIERLCFFAEHPELADPLIWFLPERKGTAKGWVK